MIKEKIYYVTDDGSEFQTYKEADEYQHICERCENIMSQLKPHPTDSIPVWQDLDLVKKANTEFMQLCGEVIPKFKFLFDEAIDHYIHPSHLKKVLSDFHIKCLWNTYYRFTCINMKTGAEYKDFPTWFDNIN